MAGPPTSPLWKRWRINYEADLHIFTQYARHLTELCGRWPAASQPKRHAGQLPVGGRERGLGTDASAIITADMRGIGVSGPDEQATHGKRHTRHRGKQGRRQAGWDVMRS